MKETITITKEEFDNTINRVFDEQFGNIAHMNGGKTDPVSALIIPLVGAVFIGNLKQLLFEDENERAERERKEKESKTTVEFPGFRNTGNVDATRINPLKDNPLGDLFGDL